MCAKTLAPRAAPPCVAQETFFILKRTKWQKSGVIIYGSRAKGNYKNGSDIDLTFIGKNISDRDWSGIFQDLDELPTPYTFDLSILSTIENPDLVDHINRVGKIFYEKST